MRFTIIVIAATLGACASRLDIGKGCESDAEFCARLGKDCDSLTAADDCGLQRTADCGTCTQAQLCGAHDTPNVCGWVGTKWTTGAATDDVDGFAAWRNNPVTVLGLYDSIGTWEEIESLAILDQDGAGRAVSLARPLTPSTEGDLVACAAGQYTDHFTATAERLAQKLMANNWGKVYVRLGWEDNESCHWCSHGQNGDWKTCFRIAAQAYQAVSQDLVILWNMNRRFFEDVSLLWPGDDVVDVVAVDFYDIPGFTNQQKWDEDYWSTHGDGPHGLGAWVDFAKRHGKKLALPEWGLSSQDPNGGGDNSFFIDKMYEFFWRNADILEFEAVFNLQGKNYQIYPLSQTNGVSDANPNAGNRYRTLWSKP